MYILMVFVEVCFSLIVLVKVVFMFFIKMKFQRGYSENVVF